MKNMFAYALLISLVSTLAHGGPCHDLSGVWRNALGSNMSVVISPDRPHSITGRYNTSVESKPGAAAFSSPIAGVVEAVQGGSLVSWNVLWSGGKSMTTWVGQCIECDGREMIFTTWALRSLQKPLDKWMTTRVNQDTFWRLEGGADQPSLPVPTSEGANSAVLGRWTSITGDALNITFAAKTGKLEGDHLTPVNGGNAEPVALFGAIDGRHNYTALGFSAVGPTAVRGWTGHIYNPQEPHPILETSWLAHSFSDKCNDPRRFVSFGMDNYTQPISSAPTSDA